MLGKDKAIKEEKIKEMCDEITLDVVDSIVTDAHEGERLAGLQRQVGIIAKLYIDQKFRVFIQALYSLLFQDTEASCCESDALSSEVRLSEGEVLLPKVKLNRSVKYPQREISKSSKYSPKLDLFTKYPQSKFKWKAPPEFLRRGLPQRVRSL